MYFGVCTCVNARVERSVREPVRTDAFADSTGTGLAGRAPSITCVLWPGQSAGRGDRTMSGAAPPAKFMVARLSQRGRMCVQDSEGSYGRERMMRVYARHTVHAFITRAARRAGCTHGRACTCTSTVRSAHTADTLLRLLSLLHGTHPGIPKFMWTWSVVHPST